MKRKVVYFLAPLIGYIFAHMSFAIPVKRLRETDTLLAFYATRPVYSFHVILTPKKDIRSFAELDPADPFMAELVSATHSLVDEFHLTSWRLVVNGGTNQDFPHLHFHLISDQENDGKH